MPAWLSPVALLSVLALVALVAAIVWYTKLRQRLLALDKLSKLVQRAAQNGALRSRITVPEEFSELAPLITSVNHLFARVSSAPAPSATAGLATPDTGNAGSYAGIGGGMGAGRPVTTEDLHGPQLGGRPMLGAPMDVLGEHVHEAVLVQGRSILYANSQFLNLLNRRPSEVLGSRLQDLVPDEYADLVASHIRRRLSGDPSMERYEVDLENAAEGRTRLELSMWPIQYDGEDAVLIVGVEVMPTPVSTALQLESPMRARAHMALEALPEPLMTTDADGRVDYVNPAAQRLLGPAGLAARGALLEDVAGAISDGDRKSVGEPLRQALSAGSSLSLGRRALRIRGSNDTEHLVELAAAPMRMETGETVGAVVTLHDVTAARGSAQEISFEASHDAQTGLMNRREFERRLQDALEKARAGESGHVMCYLDLDRFKTVNDTSGHIAGDAMLREIAKLLKQSVRDSDFVARLGGDEFGFLLMGCPLEKARQIADEVHRKVNDYRFVWKDKLFSVGISIGLVQISRESGTIEDTIAAADSACYMAKRQGGHVSVYSAKDEMAARQAGEIQWLQLLQVALRENRFELYSQSIVPAFGSENEGPGMEIFVRLRDQAGAQWPAAAFVRAAERYRLMAMVDRWVVQRTLVGLSNGSIALKGSNSVAINISGQTLADMQFLDYVVECFDSTGVDPAKVCFEISEAAVTANLEQTRRFVGVMHGMGCRFALANFGSGLGSLANLRDLGIDFLKIDGTFFRNLARDSVNQAMIGAIIKLARSLNFRVIAEQVEDVAALDAAKRMGVDYLQGFAIGKPVQMAVAA